MAKHLTSSLGLFPNLACSSATRLLVLAPCLSLALCSPRAACAAGKATRPAASAAAPKVVAPAEKPAVSEAEFEVVPAGDELYRLLAQVQGGGLLQSAPRRGSTRYELALETGRATLALASKRSSGTRVSGEASKALESLLGKLRPELRRLDVDVDASLLLCRAESTGSEVPAAALLAGTPRGGSGASPARGLSPRLRRWAALSSQSRNVSDPFGGASGRSPSFFGSGLSNRAGAARFEGVNTGPRAFAGSSLGYASTSVDVSGRLRLRAEVSGESPSARPLALQSLAEGGAGSALLGGTGATRSLGGGLDIDLPAGLTLSGNVDRISPRFDGGFEGTRIGGQARVSAFNDRLGLSVNWARLLPEEQAALSQRQSSAGGGLDISVDERVKFQLRYQQLFGPGLPNRVIAGGVNITF